MRHLLHSLAAAAMLSAILLPAANAHDAKHHDAADHNVGAVSGAITITEAWARAMLPGQRAGGGYLTIANSGAEADRLVGGSTPAAGRLEIHTMEVVNDVMTMRPVADGLEIPAGGTVELKPGGLHLMFMEIATPFAEGDTLPVTLTFEHAGDVAVELPVRAGRGGGHGAHGEGSGDHTQGDDCPGHDGH